MVSERTPERAFFGVSALLFAASAAVTFVWCASMSAMGEMPMPGGWTMSMAWMRMPRQTWPAAGASFLGLWVVMMVAMMLPSLVPMLWRYRQAVGRTGETRLGWLTALVGVGYFFVWTVFGMAAFALGVALAAVEMQQPVLARAIPIAVGVVVLIAGALQRAQAAFALAATALIVVSAIHRTIIVGKMRVPLYLSDNHLSVDVLGGRNNDQGRRRQRVPDTVQAST